MIRLLAVLIVFCAAVIGVQWWRLDRALQSLDDALEKKAALEKKVSQKNGQLIALNILTQTSNRAQVQLYAAAEKNGSLLRDRQRKIEELKRENEALRRWADSPLPDPVVRLRQRPALAGGESYREWLSQNHPVPAGPVSAAQ